MVACSGCGDQCYCVIIRTDTFQQAPADEPQLMTFWLTHFANADTIEVSVWDSVGNQIETAPDLDWTYLETDDPAAAELDFQAGAVPPPEAFIAARYGCSGHCVTPISYVE